MCNIYNHCMCHAGTVMISPPGVVPACNGDQIELTCTVTSQGLLEWRFTLTPENATSPRPVSLAISRTAIENRFNLSIDSNTFTFLRVSSQNSSPLESRLLINPVTNSLNGTEVSCIAVETSESATTIIFTITNGYLMSIIIIIRTSVQLLVV